MGKHAIPGRKWAYSAEQTAKLLSNKENLRYRQGQLDALVAVSRLKEQYVSPEQFQSLLDSLPHAWDQSYAGAYVVGFEDMYGTLCEHLTMAYAPEASKNQSAAIENPVGPARPKSYIWSRRNPRQREVVS